MELPADEGVSAIVSYADSRGGERGSTQNGPRISASNLRESAYVMMVTKAGLIKKTPLEDFTNIRRTGIIAVALEKGDELKWVRFSSGKDQVLLVTRLGQAIRFKESQIRPMGRTARGVRAIRLRKDDEVAGFDTIRENPPAGGSPAAQGRVLVVMANGFAKQTRLKEYKVQKRGGSGIRTAKITAKTGKVIGGKIIGEELLTPTRSYVGLVEALLDDSVHVSALMPGTGDGVSKICKLGRFTYRIHSWVDVKEIFLFMREKFGIPIKDCLTTFNWGIGYYIFVRAGGVYRATEAARRAGFELIEIGDVREGDHQVIFGPENDLILEPPSE